MAASLGFALPVAVFSLFFLLLSLGSSHPVLRPDYDFSLDPTTGRPPRYNGPAKVHLQSGVQLSLFSGTVVNQPSKVQVFWDYSVYLHGSLTVMATFPFSFFWPDPFFLFLFLSFRLRRMVVSLGTAPTLRTRFTLSMLSSLGVLPPAIWTLLACMTLLSRSPRGFLESG